MQTWGQLEGLFWILHSWMDSFMRSTQEILMKDFIWFSVFLCVPFTGTVDWTMLCCSESPFKHVKINVQTSKNISHRKPCEVSLRLTALLLWFDASDLTLNPLLKPFEHTRLRDRQRLCQKQAAMLLTVNDFSFVELSIKMCSVKKGEKNQQKKEANFILGLRES